MPTGSRQRHRETFFAHNGPGPYICYGCQGVVSFDETFPVHHKDGNHDNDNPENLVAMHTGCHNRLHKTGRVVSKEQRDRIGALNRGKTISAKHRAAISASNRTRVLSLEAKARIRASNKATWLRKATLAITQRVM